MSAQVFNQGKSSIQSLTQFNQYSAETSEMNTYMDLDGGGNNLNVKLLGFQSYPIFETRYQNGPFFSSFISRSRAAHPDTDRFTLVSKDLESENKENDQPMEHLQGKMEHVEFENSDYSHENDNGFHSHDAHSFRPKNEETVYEVDMLSETSFDELESLRQERSERDTSQNWAKQIQRRSKRLAKQTAKRLMNAAKPKKEAKRLATFVDRSLGRKGRANADDNNLVSMHENYDGDMDVEFEDFDASNCNQTEACADSSKKTRFKLQINGIATFGEEMSFDDLMAMDTNPIEFEESFNMAIDQTLGYKQCMGGYSIASPSYTFDLPFRSYRPASI